MPNKHLHGSKQKTDPTKNQNIHGYRKKTKNGSKRKTNCQKRNIAYSKTMDKQKKINTRKKLQKSYEQMNIRPIWEYTKLTHANNKNAHRPTK